MLGGKQPIKSVSKVGSAGVEVNLAINYSSYTAMQNIITCGLRFEIYFKKYRLFGMSICLKKVNIIFKKWADGTNDESIFERV